MNAYPEFRISKHFSQLGNSKKDLLDFNDDNYDDPTQNRLNLGSFIGSVYLKYIHSSSSGTLNGSSQSLVGIIESLYYVKSLI